MKEKINASFLAAERQIQHRLTTALENIQQVFEEALSNENEIQRQQSIETIIKKTAQLAKNYAQRKQLTIPQPYLKNLDSITDTSTPTQFQQILNYLFAVTTDQVLSSQVDSKSVPTQHDAPSLFTTANSYYQSAQHDMKMGKVHRALLKLDRIYDTIFLCPKEPVFLGMIQDILTSIVDYAPTIDQQPSQIARLKWKQEPLKIEYLNLLTAASYEQQAQSLQRIMLFCGSTDQTDTEAQALEYLLDYSTMIKDPRLQEAMFYYFLRKVSVTEHKSYQTKLNFGVEQKDFPFLIKPPKTDFFSILNFQKTSMRIGFFQTQKALFIKYLNQLLQRINTIITADTVTESTAVLFRLMLLSHQWALESIGELLPVGSRPSTVDFDPIIKTIITLVDGYQWLCRLESVYLPYKNALIDMIVHLFTHTIKLSLHQKKRNDYQIVHQSQFLSAYFKFFINQLDSGVKRSLVFRGQYPAPELAFVTLTRLPFSAPHTTSRTFMDTLQQETEDPTSNFCGAKPYEFKGLPTLASHLPTCTAENALHLIDTMKTNVHPWQNYILETDIKGTVIKCNGAEKLRHMETYDRFDIHFDFEISSDQRGQVTRMHSLIRKNSLAIVRLIIASSRIPGPVALLVMQYLSKEFSEVYANATSTATSPSSWARFFAECQAFLSSKKGDITDLQRLTY